MAVDLPLGWMRQIIGASSSKRPSQPVGCVGHFFDNARKQLMTVELGYVFVRCPFSFRSASSPARFISERAALSWVSDGAVPNDELPAHAAAFFQAGLC